MDPLLAFLALIAAGLVFCGPIALGLCLHLLRSEVRNREQLELLSRRLEGLGEAPAASRPPVSVPVPARAQPGPPARIPARSAGPSDLGRALVWLQGHWLLVAGALVLQFGVGFAVKYSFDQGWLGPWTRIALGWAVGFLLTAASFRPRLARLRPLAEALFAVGIASLYYCGFAAHAFYDLVPAGLALPFVAGVALAGGAVAGLRNLPVAGHLSLVGAYLAPLLFATGQDQQLVLFGYLFLVTGGAIVLSLRRPWPMVPVGATAAVLLLCGLWFQAHYSAQVLARSLLLHGLLLAPLVALPILRRTRGSSHAWVDLGLVCTTGAWAVGVIHLHGRVLPTLHLAGTLTAGLALAYGALAWMLWTRAPGERGLWVLHAAAGFALVPMAVAQWTDGTPVTLTLAAECAALAWLGATHQRLLPLLGAAGAGFLAGARAFLAVDSLAAGAGNDGRLLWIGLFTAATYLLGAHLLRRRGTADEGRLGRRSAWLLERVLEAGGALLLWNAAARFAEATLVRGGAAPDLRFAVGALVPAALGLLFCSWGRLRQVRIREVTGQVGQLLAVLLLVPALGAALGQASLGRVALVHLPMLGQCAVLALAAPTLWRRRRQLDRFHPLALSLALAVSVAPLAILGTEWLRLVEVHHLSDLSGQAGLSILGALYAILALGLSHRWRSAKARTGAMILFGLVVTKMFLVDLAALETIYRVFSFLAVGTLLLAAWILLRRWKSGEEFTKEDRSPHPPARGPAAPAAGTGPSR